MKSKTLEATKEWLKSPTEKKRNAATYSSYAAANVAAHATYSANAAYASYAANAAYATNATDDYKKKLWEKLRVFMVERIKSLKEYT